MRAFAGIWTKGMTSHRLQNKMNVNKVVRNGVNLRPSGPMVSITMLLSTKSMIDSATFCTPVGTNARLRLPATNKPIERSGRDPHQQDDLVDRERGVLEEDVGPFDEMADRREFETEDHAAPASLALTDEFVGGRASRGSPAA